MKLPPIPSRNLLALAILLVICRTAWTQTSETPRFAEFLEKERQAKTPNDLKACLDELQKSKDLAERWQDWASQNVPKHNALLAEYDSLTKRNEKLEAKAEQKTNLNAT